VIYIKIVFVVNVQGLPFWCYSVAM